MKKFLLSLLCLMAFVSIQAEEATLSFADKANRTSQTSNQQVWKQNGIILTNNKGASTTNVADYAKPARFYKSSEIIVEFSLGNINSITFDCNSSSYATALKSSITSSNVTVSSDKVTVTLDGTSNSFTIASLTGGQVRMDALTVTYTTSEEPTVAKPTFSVAGGTYTTPFDLVLSAEDGNTIYYTLDGTNPTVESELYQGETIKISEYTVVKAIAVDGQGATSNIATATYAFQNTKETAMIVAEALAWIEAGKDATTEQYIIGYITEITEISTSYGNATYNIADAIDSTDELVVFRGKYINGEKFTAEDEIEVGDKVLIYGKLKDYNGTPEVDTNNYIISILEDISTGVEEIAIENAPAEYYNLQGVKVARPENGIFIKKQGSKAIKVVL